ncbi:hypothetical protein COLO4_10289 [Corchorus olitorius]|uniref:Uncharacterized protein n=1 Tax=Corchorus olitorius TaxID=93759 RepID=A0A1R3K9C0_9ROSI|nr:hypothetical protein COLO4_10289 [Corchorus olitorius]
MARQAKGVQECERPRQCASHDRHACEACRRAILTSVRDSRPNM